MNWTAAEEQVLATMWAQGASLDAMAERIGRSPSAVQKKRCGMNLPARKQTRPAGAKWTPEAIATLTQMWRQGYSASQVAKKLGNGISRNAVIGKAHRLGLAGRDKPSSPAGHGNALNIRAAASKDRSGRVKGRPSRPKGQPKVKVARKSAPAPVEYVPGPGVSYDALQPRGQCRWPVGDPAEPDFHYCGAKPDTGSSYCAWHESRSRSAARPRRKRTGSLDGFLDHLSAKRRELA